MGNEVSVRESFVPDAVYDGDNDNLLESYEGVQLTPLEVAFVEAYVGPSKFSAAAAYRKVRPGQTGTHYAASLLRKPHIAKAIKFRLDTVGASAEVALSELTDVALSEWRDHIDIKMRNGEEVSVKMDLASKVRALEIILRAHNRLDNKSAVQNAVIVNINTPGIKEDDLA